MANRIDDSGPTYSSPPDPLVRTGTAAGAPVDLTQPRWRRSAMLGVGGMGKVVLMRDAWLGRDVAVKEPADYADRARFMREALVTARLEHPGIVPVYDLGTGPDGEPWFAMRVVRGRSLASILSDGLDPAARRSLLRAFHSAVEAVAFAHRSGVVHRDLKPHNIMVGQFGEAQVIDWGLAQTTELDEPTSLSGDRPVGTPRYMSPEQRRAETVDARSDVFSLGLILAEIVCGQVTRGAAGDLDTMPKRSRPCVFERRGVRELRAIVERATAPSPGDRYPDAKGLADDLARYLDGERVRAHAYSRRELVARFVRTRRVPLIVALVAALVMAGILVFALDAISKARVRAAQSLAANLVEEARRALDREALGEAGALAAEALSQIANTTAQNETLHHVAAAARGVLGAIGAAPRRERLGVLPCAPVDVHGRRVLCAELDAVVLVEDGRVVWRRPGRSAGALFADDGRTVVTLTDNEVERVDATTGALVGERFPHRFRPPLVAAAGSVVARTADLRTVRFDREGWVVLPESPCGPDAVSAFGLDPVGEHLASVCNDGTLHVTRLVDATSESASSGVRGLPTGPLPAAVAVVAPHLVLVGDSNGGLHEVLLGAPGERRDLVLDTGITRRIVVSPSRELAIVIGDRGGPALVDLARWELRLRFPPDDVRAAWFQPDGRLVTAGRELVVWDPSLLVPREIVAPSGITGLAMSRDGRQLAVANANQVTVFDAASRRRIRAWSWPEGIVKTLSYAPDGALVAQGLAGGPIRRFSASGELAPLRDDSGHRYRRLIPLADGSSIVTTWGPRLMRLYPDGRRGDLPPLDVIDIAGSPDGARVVALATDFAVCIGGLPERAPLARVGLAPGGVATAVRDDGAFVVATAHGVQGWVWREGAPRILYRAPGAELVAVATTPGWVAAGSRDGSTFLWADGEEAPRARLPSHRDRVENLAFDPRGRWLAAGGWDGRVTLFELGAMALSSDAIEDAWGVSAADVRPLAEPLAE